MAQLRAYKDNGIILFDTNLICYGMVKSGYLSYIESWSRREYLQNNQDPNWGGNWSPVVVNYNTSYTDALHGFTIYGWISPICFITGPGCLNGTRLNGDGSMTFLYSNAGTGTRFYCFDLMGNNIAGSPYLKTYDTSGRITFNSLQPPLNVIGQIQPPGPGAVDQFNRPKTTYLNGYSQKEAELGSASPWRRKRATSRLDINLNGGIEYAAFLPWSRTCTFNDIYDFNGIFNFSQYGAQEGAYGRVGGITFIFGASAGTTNSSPATVGFSSPFSIQNLPNDRIPTALLINTANYPFPYN